MPANLNDQQRHALVLRYTLDGGQEGERTEAEVAKRIGVSESKAKSLIAEALKKLDLDDSASVAQVRDCLNAQ